MWNRRFHLSRLIAWPGAEQGFFHRHFTSWSVEDLPVAPRAGPLFRLAWSVPPGRGLPLLAERYQESVTKRRLTGEEAGRRIELQSPWKRSGAGASCGLQNRCPAWVSALGGGFDSHALPPSFFLLGVANPDLRRWFSTGCAWEPNPSTAESREREAFSSACARRAGSLAMRFRHHSRC